MKAFFKGIAFVLIMVILLSLCLTPMVFATEEPSYSGDAPLSPSIGIKLPEERSFPEPPSATPSDAEEEKTPGQEHSEPPKPSSAPVEPDVLSEPPAATSSDAAGKPSEPEPPGSDIKELPLTTPFAAVATPSAAVKKAPPQADTVSTGGELFQWLSDHGGTGGVVTLSDDIYLCDFIYVHGFRQPAVTIDTGEFSIIAADGYAELHAGSPLTIRGIGGENGVLRAAEGGMLQINGLTLEAEEGYAVFQEEGAGLLIEQTSVSGAVHYAKLPYVSEWEDAQVVEERGQIFDAGHLPAALDGRVIRQGRITDFHEEVPVTWDLTGHEEAQKQRQRFTVTGEFESMASQKAPVCTVVYDDFPLTFLEVTAKRITGGRGDAYKFTGTFSKPEDRLPIAIAQEYSFDGENWMLYEKKEVDHLDETFTIYLSAGTGEQSPPDIFIRLSWDDGGTMYYSNVLRFTGDSLEESGEHGGNRGGGTDIINPPETPEPDPEPPETETTPPEPSEPETMPPPEISEPETTPPEPPEPETTPPPEISEPETTPPEPPELETTPPEISQPAPTQPGHNDTDHEAGASGDGESSSTEDTGGHWDTQGSAQEGSPKPGLSDGPSGSGGGQSLSSAELSSGPDSEPSPAREAVNPLAVTGEEAKSPSAEAARMPSGPPPAEETEPPESHKGIPAEAEETPGRTPPVKQPKGTSDGTPPVKQPGAPADPAGKSLPPTPEDNPQAAAKPAERSAPQRPDASSAAAGLAAIAVSMGGAALYLHPKARKRLVEKLRNLFKR